MEFEWNIVQDSIRCSSAKKSEEFYHVDVQRLFLWNKTQRNRMSGKRQTRISVREKIWKRTTWKKRIEWIINERSYTDYDGISGEQTEFEWTSSTRIRRRTCHSQIETYDEFDSEDAFGRVVFNFIKPGEDLVWILRSWKICCK